MGTVSAGQVVSPGLVPIHGGFPQTFGPLDLFLEHLIENDGFLSKYQPFSVIPSILLFHPTIVHLQVYVIVIYINIDVF